MCPVWLLVAVVVVGVARGAVSQCWENPNCQEVTSESSVMECIQLCHADLTAETPVIPGHAHLQPPPLSDAAFFILPPSSSSPQAKRSYSMEHFRWGKPVGRKRRPIKVYTSNGVEEESAEVFPREVRRRELARELLLAAQEEEEAQDAIEEEEEEDLQLLGGVHQKKDGSYKMKHFRWGRPSWDERSQRPLLTLFKNVMNKDGQQ
uniref:Corticotropin n=1 Tax=Scophthalmus maximus TaxID=52904 RepID=A0A8D2ZPJ2_SCOMX